MFFKKKANVDVKDAGDELNGEGVVTEGTEGETKETKKPSKAKATAIKVAKGVGIGLGAAGAAVLGFKFRGIWDRVGETLVTEAAAEVVPEIAEKVVEEVTVDPVIVDEAAEAIKSVIEEA